MSAWTGSAHRPTANALLNRCPCQPRIEGSVCIWRWFVNRYFPLRGGNDWSCAKPLTAMDADFLVLGSGLAGLSFALKAAQSGTVIVLTKDRLPESATAYAQGGIASVWSSEDSFEEHSQDTMTAGGDLCHGDIVDLVVREGPERIRELIALGTRFSLRPGAEDNAYDLG